MTRFQFAPRRGDGACAYRQAALVVDDIADALAWQPRRIPIKASTAPHTESG
ncbi:hypothetical protein [Streptomyces sp. MBT33]|uniref:hypothetical protein n=1 Tax=Streptomyces sp. MBT33 TaxID=1488363 RepID=UPI00190DDC84|nr:hypothetical protein [Streptomyces sp. MBT33]MBK3642912.1 hypothetical protein [Streptomyces sp. MBT33]